MAFCLKKKESISKATRRLGRERLEDAVACLKEGHRAEAIHCARKDIKKVRAVMRLVRPRIKKKKFVRLTRPLRDAANHLAAPRDAYIKAQTLRKLAHHFKGQLAPGALRHVRADLRKDFDDELKRFGQNHTASAVEKALCQVMKALERLKINGRGWRALSPGVKAAYREGRRAYQRARKDPSPENFHRWRKRTKDLWYHVRLLHPVWPEQMEAMAGELEALSESVGDDHDLVVLRRDVEERSIGEEIGRAHV